MSCKPVSATPLRCCLPLTSIERTRRDVRVRCEPEHGWCAAHAMDQRPTHRLGGVIGRRSSHCFAPLRQVTEKGGISRRCSVDMDGASRIPLNVLIGVPDPKQRNVRVSPDGKRLIWRENAPRNTLTFFG